MHPALVFIISFPFNFKFAQSMESPWAAPSSASGEPASAKARGLALQETVPLLTLAKFAQVKLHRHCHAAAWAWNRESPESDCNSFLSFQVSHLRVRKRIRTALKHFLNALKS